MCCAFLEQALALSLPCPGSRMGTSTGLSAVAVPCSHPCRHTASSSQVPGHQGCFPARCVTERAKPGRALTGSQHSHHSLWPGSLHLDFIIPCATRSWHLELEMNLKKYKCSANYCSGVSCSAALTQSQLRLLYWGLTNLLPAVSTLFLPAAQNICNLLFDIKYHIF